jgi:hypothetical protein
VDKQQVYEKAVKQQETPSVKRIIPTVKNCPFSTPIIAKSSPAAPRSNESFVVLTQSQITKSPQKQVDSVFNSTPSTSNGAENDVQRLRISAKLLDAISGRSDVDYLMCTECADILLENMSAKHVKVKKE